jgi:NADPH:quinone reductase-like Zn-dependent oxidoreductase
MKALGFDRFGGPEVLAIREVPDPEPQPGHAIVRMQAIGLNFAVLDVGADLVILDSEDWVTAARELAADGVDVAYDSVGITLPRSFEAVRTGGHVVFYGMAGGDPPLVDPRMLMDTSKRITGGDLWNVLRTAEDRRGRAAELFD